MTRRGLAEADRVLRAAEVKWFELRRFFHDSCERAALQLPKRPLPTDAIYFMLGNYVKEELDLSLFNPRLVEMLRDVRVILLFVRVEDASLSHVNQLLRSTGIESYCQHIRWVSD